MLTRKTLTHHRFYLLKNWHKTLTWKSKMDHISVRGGKESKRPELGAKIIKKSPLFNLCTVGLTVDHTNSHYVFLYCVRMCCCLSPCLVIR